MSSAGVGRNYSWSVVGPHRTVRGMRLPSPFLVPALALGAAVGAIPATATAATPINLGPASAVDVAVDALGAAHVVATDPDTGNVRYCLIPRGVGGCTRTASVPMPGTGDRGVAHIQVDGARVLVTSVRYGTGDGDGPVVVVSNDGGQTFGPGVRTASDDGLAGGQQVLGPDNGLWHAYAIGYSLWTVRLATDGSAPTSDWQVEFDDGYSPYDGDGGLAIVGGTVIAARGGEHPAFFTHVIGGGPANLRAGWSAPTAIARAAGSEWISTASLASGTKGAVMTTTEGASLTAAITARRWTGSGFSAPVELYRHTGGSNNAANGEVAADASGGLHAVYAGDNESYVRYSHSADGGASWGPSHLIEANESSAPSDMRVSAAPDGQGFTAFTRDGNALVVPLEPIAPPSEPAPPVVQTPPGVPTPPAPTPPTVKKQVSKKQATTTVRVGDSDLILGLPTGCLAPGDVRVTFKVQARKVKQAKRRAGRVVVKVRRVTFTVDGKRRKVDGKAPFVQTLKLKGLKPGSTHTVRARAELKQKQKGPKRYRTVSRKVKICS